jgi:hypothetical protein
LDQALGWGNVSSVRRGTLSSGETPLDLEHRNKKRAMKKLITLSVLTACFTFTSTQQASAWSNIRFGAGVNLHWQTGDNNLLWGFFRNGQIPYPAGGGYGMPGPGGGFQGYYDPTGTVDPNAAKQSAATPAAPAAPAVAPNPGTNQVSYGQNPYGAFYQPVSYYPNNNNQAPTYTPNYPYYPYQVPSYWYGQ